MKHSCFVHAARKNKHTGTQVFLNIFFLRNSNGKRVIKSHVTTPTSNIIQFSRTCFSIQKIKNSMSLKFVLRIIMQVCILKTKKSKTNKLEDLINYYHTFILFLLS